MNYIKQCFLIIKRNNGIPQLYNCQIKAIFQLIMITKTILTKRIHTKIIGKENI